MRIDLSTEEWNSFSREIAQKDNDEERESGECALPMCCADVSNLRDAILAIAENAGVVTDMLKQQLEQAWYELSTHSHDSREPWTTHPTFQKFLKQAGLSWSVE